MARFDLTGKVALVTGGAEGIGQELSTTLAEQGADIAIFDIKEELMEKMCIRDSWRHYDQQNPSGFWNYL